MTRTCPSFATLLASLAALWLYCPDVARANDFEDFQQARRAYDNAEYAAAVTFFESLVGHEIPRLRNRSLVLESHKYLGASYLFVGRPGDAEAQFERLLRMEQDYVLDPLGFPREVQVVFARVREREAAARVAASEDEARAAAEAALRRQEALDAERTRLRALRKLASTEHVVEHHSRWVAALPFGIGQYQNGDTALGLALAAGSGILLATNVTSYFLHDSVTAERVTSTNRDSLRASEATFRYTNQISLALLLAATVGGIIDAQVRFEPTRSYDRERPLPPEHRDPVDIRFGATGISGRF